MLTAEEKWELYYKKAVALLNDNRSVWDEFFEASRVLKLSCHKDALEHLRHFIERESQILSLQDVYIGSLFRLISYQIVCGKRILAILLTILFVCVN